MSTRRRMERPTPYSSRTRRRHKRGLSPDFMPEYVPTADEVKAISGLLSKTWVLHVVSPLWKFDYPQLTVYSKLLYQHISAHEKRSEVRTVNLLALERFGRAGSAGIEITVNRDGGSQLFTAVLCTMSQPASVKKGFTSLPLLLSQGDSALTALVLDWLQTTFDCHVAPYSLEQDDLYLLLAQYATAGREGRGVSGVELVYEVPERVKSAGLATLSLELPYESAVSLWDSVTSHKVERTRAGVPRKTSSQRELFIHALKEHLEQHFHLKMESLTLSRVATPALHADKSGRLKFQSSSHVIPALTVLQERQAAQS